MLEARSVALVGATPRPGSLGMRALTELGRSPGRPSIHLVNPARAGTTIGGRPVLASLEEVAGPVDLVLAAVGDAHLESVLADAARHGAAGAVVFASAVDPVTPGDSAPFRARLAAIARDAGMALCGGGCMGFVSRGLRAIGYLERDPLPAGPIALVTHSGSAFSALLRAERPFAWSLAVSSGQELVTTAADYLEYALGLPETGIVVLVAETLRDVARLRSAFDAAAERDIPVVALPVGTSEAGRAMVAAHSGALAGGAAAFEALFRAHGVVQVADLAELCDTVELLLAARRHRGPARAGGALAAVLDSGAERALLVDVADELGVPFATVAEATTARLEELLDPGMAATNPLDLWGSGRATGELFTEALLALSRDASVSVVALAVDLVPEFDGDDSYPTAALAVAAVSQVPVCVLSHVPSALDREAAAQLRGAGVAVLEGTRPGLAALGHLLSRAGGSPSERGRDPEPDRARRERWRARLAAGPLRPDEAVRLLADYGIASPATRAVFDEAAAVAAAAEIGFPVALKTAEGDLAHKSEVGGVVLGLPDAGGVAAAYADLRRRLGPAAVVCEMAPAGVELSLGVVRDPLVGPLVVVGAGGVLVELIADRAVALPPVGPEAAARLVSGLRVARLLEGFRGGPPADLAAVARALGSMSALAIELGDELSAVEVNPLSCAPSGALALDILVEVPVTRR